MKYFLRLWPTIPAIILATLIIFTLIPEQLAPRPSTAPYPPACDVLERNRKPSSENLLGTDYVGCDILSRMIYDTRPIMVASVLSLVIGALVGFYVGIVGGYFEGFVSKVILKASNIWIGVSALLILAIIVELDFVILTAIAAILILLAAIAAILVLFSTVVTIFLALLSGTASASKISLGMLTPRTRSYIHRARRRGISTPYIILKRVVPRTSRVILVLSVLSGLFIYNWVALLMGMESPPAWYTTTSDWFSTYSPITIIAMILWFSSPYLTLILLAAWLRNRLPRF